MRHRRLNSREIKEAVVKENLPLCGTVANSTGIFWVEGFDCRFILASDDGIRAYHAAKRRIETLREATADEILLVFDETIPWAQRTVCGQCQRFVKDCRCAHTPEY